MKHKSLFFALGLLGLFLAACSGAVGPGGSSVALETAPVVDALAPDFELQTIEGETIRLSDFRGKAVLVNFWATWCGPCRIEMPAIQDRFDRHAGDLVVLAVDNDETEEAVEAFFDDLDLTFEGVLDPGGETQDVYQVRGYPSSYFVDQDGVIRVVHIGVMTEGQIDDYLSQVGIDV